MNEKPNYKLRFPSTEAGAPKYLLFNEEGALVIETEGRARSYDWISPADTVCFLDAIGELDRKPEFVKGEPTAQTKSLLRRLIKQFTGVNDLYRCWKRIGVRIQSFSQSDTE